MMLKETFAGKTVLVTGHTGFKGSWLTAWMQQLGARVVGIALAPPSVPSHFEAAAMGQDMQDLRMDVRDRRAIEEAIVTARPDFVFHLAAQAIVRHSYADPVATWETNVLGTLHVLEALRKVDNTCTAVLITSDKCYDNVEWVWGYRETDTMGGGDPYSASKGAAELAIKSHIRSYFRPGETKVRVTSARAGNVIGGGDWAADRIVPDCVRAWAAGNPVILRNPHSTRPWQHVLEPLSGYIHLAAELSRRPELHGEPFNFGPSSHVNQTVLQLVQKMALHWENVKWVDASQPGVRLHESNLLKLNCDKALFQLSWEAVLDFSDTVKMTAEWYRSYYAQSAGCRTVTSQQIQEYTEKARAKGLPWAV